MMIGQPVGIPCRPRFVPVVRTCSLGIMQTMTTAVRANPSALQNTRIWLFNAWVEWQRVLMFGAMACVLLLSPSTYDAANRHSMARQIYFTSWRVLPWFIVLSGVVSWVLIRVVLVTALHYGLQRFALDLVVRVLVLEVIPLFAALYVALRNAVSARDDVRGIFIPQDLDRLGAAETDRVRDELVPRVVATMLSVLTMVVISGLATLLLAYLNVYGLSRWGLPEFARTVGQAFDVVVALGFILKVVLFSLAVAVIPIATALNYASLKSANATDASSLLQPGTMRVFLSLMAVEVLALVVRFI